MDIVAKTIGIVFLIVGVLLLVSGIVLGFTVGTVAVPILLSSSIVINTVGVTLLRWKR